MAKIRAVYNEAARLTWETGIQHDVDHYVPLNHPFVCGLHVDYNLRPMPSKLNGLKGNDFDMGHQLGLFDET